MIAPILQRFWKAERGFAKSTCDAWKLKDRHDKSFLEVSE